MLLTLPGLIYLLNLSLSDRAGFSQVAGILASPVLKLVAVLFCWALSHHILAGIRFMLLDFDVAVERGVARMSAWLVHVCAVLITLAAAGLIFGVIGGVAK
jgi:succinate dehydrogenase / fumarate reductase cytochrome b subunit